MNKIPIDINLAGERADKLLSSVENSVSRSFVKKWFEQGLVTVSGKKIKPSYVLCVNDIVEYDKPLLEESNLVADESVEFGIVFEDEYFAIINKPAGVVVHPGKGNSLGTLASGLMAKFPSLSGVNGKKRPGILHRLDKETSGLMIIVKNDDAHIKFSQMMQNREIDKYYLALVAGALDGEKEINFPIGKSFTDGVKMTVGGIKPRDAITFFKPIEHYLDSVTLVEAKLITGRTHQIRVHCDHAGFPIVGERLYSSSLKKLEFTLSKRGVDLLRYCNKKMNRQALFAQRLVFKHPINDEIMDFTASPPNDFLELVNFLRTNYKSW